MTLTYGTIVAQLCQDYDGNYHEVNKQLEKMGYNIGMRLIEDFLAKSTVGRCANFRETADMIAKVRCQLKYPIFPMKPSEINNLGQVGFKIFLNITPTVTNWTSDNNQFSLIFDENPLADFVELPDDGRAQDELWFSNILCGVLRGALEMVSPIICCSMGRYTYAHFLPFRCKCRLKHTSLATFCVEMTRQKCEYHL